MSNTTTNAGAAGQQKNAWEQKELGVLWKRTKNGTTESYLTGTLNLKALGFDKDIPLVVFSNKRKEKDTHPDLKIYLSERKPQAANAAPASPAPTAAPVPPQSRLI